MVRHRTGTHGLLLAALSVVAGLAPLPHTLSAAFLLGALSHVLSDCLTISGVPLLWPWHKTPFHPLPKRLRLRTGSAVEGGLSTLLVIVVFRLLWR